MADVVPSENWRREEILMALRLFHALTPEEAEIKLGLYEAEVLRHAAHQVLQMGADGHMDPSIKSGKWVTERRRQWWRMGVGQAADRLGVLMARLRHRGAEYREITGRTL